MTIIPTKWPAIRSRLPALLLLGCSCLPGARAAIPGDTHSNAAGFFDIHVCNWPGRSPFFMPLFSTARFNEVQSIEVLTPGGELLVALDLERYRTIKGEKQADKRVFIQQLDVPPAAVDGWYTARTRLANGEEYVARDYVIVHILPQASGQVPADEEEVAAIPAKLSWDPVPGAGFYQVFIRDLWDDSKLIHTSKLLTQPELNLPPGLLQSGGNYSWIIHARDTNNHILLGDFNHGSLNKPVSFSVQ
jgi:hypothetical protein